MSRLLKASAILIPVIGLSYFAATTFASDTANTTATTPSMLTDVQKTAVAQAYELRLNGKFDEAKTVEEAANVPRLNPGMREGRGRMGGPGRENADGLKKAFENNDYAAFKKLIENTPMASKIDEADFAKLVQAHKLMTEGKRDEAAAIFKEVGFGPGFGPGMGKGMGPGMGSGWGNRTGRTTQK